jgi:hypothetical protein
MFQIQVESDSQPHNETELKSEFWIPAGTLAERRLLTVLAEMAAYFLAHDSEGGAGQKDLGNQERPEKVGAESAKERRRQQPYRRGKKR